jgi:hypothetical protein
MLGSDPEFLREADLGGDASCYIFRGSDNALVAVAWHHWDALNWTGFHGYPVAGLFGSVLSHEELDEVEGTVYVLGGPADPAAFAQEIERAVGP